MGANARRLEPKHLNVCRYCGKEFLAKMQRTSICYEDECRRKKVRDDERRKRARRKAAKDQET